MIAPQRNVVRCEATSEPSPAIEGGSPIIASWYSLLALLVPMQFWFHFLHSANSPHMISGRVVGLRHTR